MKIDNQDIIRSARQLRDEENEQLHVSPWNRHRHFHIPTWLVAIPAAAVIGFIFGLWTQSRHQNDNPLTALVDTVYIEVPAPQPAHDTASQDATSQDAMPQAILATSTSTAATPASAASVHRSAVSTSPSKDRSQQSLGRPVADDHIRYDLLVRN